MTQNILSYALSNDCKVGFSSGTFPGNSYTEELPDEGIKYGTWEITKRTQNTVTVKLFSPYKSTMWINSYVNTAGWNGWKQMVVNTDLGNATFWFPTFVLGWDSYTNGTHQLTQSIANKPLLICAGKNGSLSGFWARTQANDDRVIMTPEGAITIHFDSLTQVTITGATSTWNVRSIQIF